MIEAFDELCRAVFDEPGGADDEIDRLRNDLRGFTQDIQRWAETNPFNEVRRTSICSICGVEESEGKTSPRCYDGGRQMTLSPQEIRQAASAINEVDNIDTTIKSILEIAPNVYEDYGKSVRDLFGRMRLSQFRSEYLGSVVICAVINALLEERSRIVLANEITEFPDAPCSPKQAISR